MRDPVIMDEGLWAGSARGKVLFDDYFAEDHGEGLLIAPLYTGVQVAVYRTLGLGLWQTRLFAALAGAATLLLLGRWMALRGGVSVGVWTAALGGVTQLLDQHSRMALLEMPQAMCITGAFVALFARRPTSGKSFIAGIAMAAGFAIKPNTVDFGIVPIGAAWLVGMLRRGEEPLRPWLDRALAAVGGGMTGLCVFVLPIWLSHWQQFLDAAKWESGMPLYSVGEHLLRLAHPGTWTPIRDAPTVLLGAWAWLLLRPTAADDRGERLLLVWFGAALLMCEASFAPAPRRYVLAMVPACALAAARLSRRREFRAVAPPPRSSYGTSLLLVLLPALLVKRRLQLWLAPQLPLLGGEWWRVAIMEHDDPRDYVATWIWLGMVLGVAALLCLRAGVVHRLRALANRTAPFLVVGLAMFEAAHLGCLPPHSHSMTQATRILQEAVPTGSTVAGMFAATLLMGHEVHTVWRVVPGRLYSTPCPNPDACERLQPQFVLDGSDVYQEMSDVTAAGFTRILHLQLLPTTEGPRIELDLWRRR